MNGTFYGTPAIKGYRLSKRFFFSVKISLSINYTGVVFDEIIAYIFFQRTYK